MNRKINLPMLYPMQQKLDRLIEQEKGLQGQELLEKRMLALQVELGEMANELPETFKFWANKKNDYEKALKEYVDCLHFILSIGLELGFTKVLVKNVSLMRTREITKQLNLLFKNIVEVNMYRDSKLRYVILVNNFLKLGSMLGFTPEIVEKAYFDKNKINFERQESGY